MSVSSFSTRTWIAIALVVALIANITWQIISGWGLITIDAENQPLGEVVRSIEKQGHIELNTNLDPETPVTMSVVKVPVTEALETLATVTESRWRYVTVAAADAGRAKAGFLDYFGGGNREAWTMVQARGFFDELVDGAPLDPRRDVVTGQQESDFVAWLRSAAMETDANFLVQADWNPALAKLPKSGRVEKAVPGAVRSLGGKTESFFALVTGGGGGWSGGGGPPGGGGPGGGFDPQRMEQTMQAMERRIANLPPAARETAKAELASQRAFFEQVRNLPEEERRDAFRTRMEQRMEDPAVQDRMEDRMSRRDARRTPEQRVQRFRDYVSRKLEAAQEQ